MDGEGGKQLYGWGSQVFTKEMTIVYHEASGAIYLYPVLIVA